MCKPFTAIVFVQLCENSADYFCGYLTCMHCQYSAYFVRVGIWVGNIGPNILLILLELAFGVVILDPSHSASCLILLMMIVRI